MKQTVYFIEYGLNRRIRYIDSLDERRTLMRGSVRMYTLSTCSHCKNVKRFMDDNSISYDFTDVDLMNGEERKKIMDEVRKYNPNCTFPTILIGDNIIIGYNESAIRGALGLK